MPVIPDEIMDVIKLCGMVNSEGKKTNEALGADAEKMGFTRIIPKFDQEIRRDSGENEVRKALNLPPTSNPLPQPPLGQFNPENDSKNQKEFAFVESIVKKSTDVTIFNDMLISLRNIEYKLDINNKNLIELLKNLPKKRVKNGI